MSPCKGEETKLAFNPEVTDCSKVQEKGGWILFCAQREVPLYKGDGALGMEKGEVKWKGQGKDNHIKLDQPIGTCNRISDTRKV